MSDPFPPPPAASPAPAAPYNAADAIGFGWKKFTASPATLLVPVLIVVVVVVVLEVIGNLVIGATLLSTHSCDRTYFGVTVQSQCGPGFIASLVGYALLGFIAAAIAGILSAGLIKAALGVIDGREVPLGEVFSEATKPNVIVAALLVAAATFVGELLCYFPGLIVGFLLIFTMWFVVDRDMAPVDAMKASVSLVTSNLGPALLFFLLAALITIAGAIACLVGLLVAVPVVLGAAAYTFRRLNGQPVAPA